MRSSLPVYLIFLLLLTASAVQAQVSITALPFNYSQNFAGFTGTSAGLPAGWTATGTFTERGQGNGSSNAGGMWAYGNSPEYALGALCSGTSSSIQYRASFRNNAASPVTSITIEFDMEQWRYGGGNTNGFAVSQTGMGAANVTSLNTNSGSSSTGTPTVTHKALTLNSLNIAPGATFSLAWSISDGSGTDNGVAIDNFTLSASTNASPAPPVVTADPVNDTACSGTAATFGITATNTTGYQWQVFNAGWTNLTNTVPYSGVTTAALSVSNVTGLNGRQYRCIAIGAPVNDTSAAATLVVKNLPAITLQCVAAAVCPGKDTSFYIRATGTNITYQWQADAGSGFANISNGTNYAGVTTDSLRIISPVATMNGYRYRCVVSGDCTPQQISTPVLLTVFPLPVATITPGTDFSFCKGDSITFTAGTGTGYIYEWTFNGSPVAGATTSVHKDTASGTYNILIKDANGCSRFATPVTATSVAHNAAIVAATSTTFCTGDSVVLNANTGTGLTYQWFKDGALIPGAAGAALSAKVNGAYKAVVANNIGCTDTSNVITVIANTGPPANITAGGPVAFCQNDSVTLDAGFVTGLTYQWTLNGTPLPGATAAVHKAKLPGNYSVKVATGANCFTFATPLAITVHPNPIAQAITLNSPVFCQGDSVVIVANPGFSYQWQQAGVNVPGAVNDTLGIKTSGNYRVVVTDANGCHSTSNAIITTVNALPAATVTPAGTNAICVNDSLALQANTGAGLSYQWYFNNAVIAGASAAGYKAGLAGNYSVQVTDANSCRSVSATTNLVVNPLPDAATAISGDTVFCQGKNVVISATSGAANLAYQWLINGNSVSGSTASYTAVTSGSYKVILINTVTGCRDTSRAVKVVANPLPASNITAATPLTFCDGDSVVLQTNAASGLTYQWTRNGILQHVSTAKYTARFDGVYAVTVTDTNGCFTTSGLQTVTVNPVPSATITYTSPLVFCDGGAVVLTAFTGSGLTYQWYKDGQSQGITTYSNIVYQSGQYTVVQTNGYGCSRATAPVAVSVLPVSVPVVTRAGASLTTDNYSSYQWYRNNQPLVGATHQSIHVTDNGGYHVEVIDANGCTGRSQIVFFNNVGVGAVTAAEISIYPNPVQQVLHFKAPFRINAVLRDMKGQTVLQQQDVQQLDVASLPQGIYLLQVSDAAGRLIHTQKISKLN